MTKTTGNERATIARLAHELVPTLIERLAKSELGELEVREDGWRIRLRRPSADGAAGGPVAVTQSPTHKPTVASHSAEAHSARREPPRGLITSPAVGYFAPRDGVAVGSSLRAGDLIGNVDVLGVRQEVVSPVDGVLREIEVQPGQAVEYGQPIGRVEANA